jgi:hypothetical protein
MCASELAGNRAETPGGSLHCWVGPHHAHGAPPGHRSRSSPSPTPHAPAASLHDPRNEEEASGSRPRPAKTPTVRAREQGRDVRCRAGISPRSRPDPATATFPVSSPLALANHTRSRRVTRSPFTCCNAFPSPPGARASHEISKAWPAGAGLSTHLSTPVLSLECPLQLRAQL